MKAKRIFLAAMLTVAVGSMFVFAGCGDKGDENKVDGNHQHSYVWTIDKEATCTEVGHRTGKCECGDEKSEEIPLAPHKLEGEITPTTDATCTAEGTGTQMCSVCHTAQPVTIPKKDHTLEYHAGITATCKEDGQLEYWHCSTCGNDYLDDKGQNLAGSVTIPKESVDHTWNADHICSVCGIADPNSPHTCVPTLVAGTPSTCKDHGTKEHYKCFECGKLYEDQAGKKEITEADLVLELSKEHGGRQNAVFHEEVESKTCTTYGTKANYECKVCGKRFKTIDLNPDDMFQDYEDVGEFNDDVLQTPKLNYHARWMAHAKEDATCVKTGWTEAVVECQICGNFYKASEFNQNSDGGSVKTKTDEDGKEIPGELYDPIDRNEYEIEIDPNNHESKLVGHFANSTTNGCGRQGVGYQIECYECTSCGNFYNDDKGSILLKKDEVLIFADHGDIVEVDEVASTCTTAGHPAHWECKSCGEWFNTGAPAAATDPIPESERDLPLLPHDFADYKFNSKGHWLTCRVCGKADTDDNGDLKIEAHDMDDGESEECIVCSFGGVDYTGIFKFEIKTDEAGEEYASIEGLFQAAGENYKLYELVNEGETSLRIPATDREGHPVKEIQEDALGTRNMLEYKNVFSSITEVIIPNSVTTIGEGAFYGFWERMPGFQRIEFEAGPNAVSLGKNTFRALTNLKTLILPEKVVSLPDDMVNGCTALTKIQMPKEITGEGGQVLTGVFKDCSALEEVDLWCYADKPYQLGSECFSGCSALKTIYLPQSITQLGHMSMYGCTAIENIYFGGDEAAWTTLCNNSKATDDDPYNWNYNNAILSNEESLVGTIVKVNTTHTGSEY